MDFDKLFNINQEDEKETSSNPIDSVKSLIEEAAKGFQSTQEERTTRKFTKEDAIAAIEKEHGSVEKYAEEVLPKMYSEYAKVSSDELANYIDREGKNQYGSVVAASFGHLLGEICKKMIRDNTDNELEATMYMAKAMKTAVTVNQIIEDDTPMDSLITCLALVPIILKNLTELTMHQEAERLMREQD